MQLRLTAFTTWRMQEEFRKELRWSKKSAAHRKTTPQALMHEALRW
jgi:hypothetical protein